jgi:ankyrin repeat protein
VRLAAKKGYVNIVRLFLDRGASHFNPEFPAFDKRTLIAEAAKSGHAEVVQLLIDRGADLHAVGEDGLTPLAWASKEARDDVVVVLKHAGAKY